ncbi:MAG: DUF4159 domain-containing protein [Kiritimatiellae bacterium]|nr:DUF4159 domain-containing protein [Kiritimatiellia bacterium]
MNSYVRFTLGNGRLFKFALAALLAASSMGGQIFDGDGSDEPGFVPPPPRKETPPPPANMSGGETFVPYPPPPATPASRSEKKNPPKPPTMFTKLTSKYGELDWNARPNDLNNLLKSLKGMADVDYDFEAKSFSEIDEDPDQNPILYRSGHFHWSLNAAERQKLRNYLLRGGTIILNAGMGSKPFYDSAIRVLNEVFPEAPVQRLSADHPIFHAYYSLDRVNYRPGVRSVYRGNDPWIDGVTIDCRTVAIVSRFGMEVGWDPLEDDNILAYEAESAQQLGMNILSYASAMRNWTLENMKKTRFEDSRHVSTAGSMNITQIIYSGEWKTRHTGLSVLLAQYNLQTGVPVKFSTREMKLTDPKLLDSPVIYLTGHETFTLKPEEVNALRNYLNGGGMLFAEACCGRKAFDTSFRALMAQVLPGVSPSMFKQGSPIFKVPNDIGSMKVTPACAKAFNNSPAIAPQILTWSVDGNPVVLYSPIGMAGAWELSPNKYCNSYLEDDAIKLGVNILMYASTR